MLGYAILVGLVLLALGVPIFAVFLTLTAAAAVGSSHGFSIDFSHAMENLFSLGTSEITAPILSTIPLFILAGFMMAESKTADRAVRVAQAALGWLPGGLAVCTILACAIFTTFTGASGVTIVALGGLLMPSLLKEHYPERFSLGLIAGTGSVGLLFPPAVPLFVYGTIYGLAAQSLAAGGGGEMKLIEFSTDRFVFAGIVPGLVLIGMLMIFAVYVAIRRGVPRTRFDFKAMVIGLVVALPELLIPVLIILGLVGGLQLPQIASLAVLYVALIETLVYRDLPLAKLWKVVRASLGLAGAIFAIVMCAQAFTSLLVIREVPQAIVDFILAHFHAKWSFLLALNVMLLVVGMVMDIFSAIVVIVPLIAPAAIRMGIDPYHLGVIFLLNLEVGYLHPPVGLNLFITSFTFRKPILEVTIAALPFLGIMIVALGVITYVPSLTVVPEAERRGRVSELAHRVHDAAQLATAAQEVKLPDGKAMKAAECDAMSDLDKGECRSLFIDVSKCRAAAAGQVGGDCEQKAIQAYVDSKKDDTDEGWDDGDAGPDDDLDAGAKGGGKPAESKPAEHKPAESKPAEHKPAESKPATP